MKSGVHFLKVPPAARFYLNWIAGVRRYVALASLIASLGLSPTPSDAVELGTFRVGNWAGAILANTSTGAFESCQGTARYENGTALSFAVKENRAWSFGLGSDRWAFEPGTLLQLSYSIDTSPPAKINAIAASPQQLSIALSSDEETYLRFRRGARLRVKVVGDEVLTFDLTQTDDLIPALLDCAQHNGRAHNVNVAEKIQAPMDFNSASTSSEIPWADSGARDTNSNDVGVPNIGAANIPSGSAGFGAVSSEAPIIRTTAQGLPTPLERVEATAELANLLAGADIRGFEIIPAHEAPEVFARHDAIWRSNMITGSLRILTNNELGDLDLVRATLIASDARGCTGQFAALALSDQADTEVATVSMSTACENGQSDWSAFYSTHARANGGYYLLTLVGDPEAADQIKTMGAQLQQVATTPRSRPTFQALPPQ